MQHYHDPHQRCAYAFMQVPVFVFELDRDVAVLLDEHYNAKALEDMILVVKNTARECVRCFMGACIGFSVRRV